MNNLIARSDDRSPFDAIRRTREDGSEFWSARDLMPLLGYGADWRNFAAAIERARVAAEVQGHPVSTLFVGVTEKTAGRPREDFELARFACYLVAMNGDPRKPEVAAAQAYFAIRTREAETTHAAILPDRKTLAQWVVEAEERAEREAAARLEAEQRARELAAPASAWTHMADSAGDYSVADAAKVLSRDPAIRIGRDRLFRFMAAEGWIFRDRGRGCWKAYQTQVDCGRLVEKLGAPYLHEPSGEMRLPDPTIRVTAKGLAELHKRLGGSGQLPLMGAVS